MMAQPPTTLSSGGGVGRGTRPVLEVASFHACG